MPRVAALRLASMTGFARTEGSTDGLAWIWELRSVNGRGLDLRLRLPSGWDLLEPALREAAGQVLRRGNVSATLSVKRETEGALAPGTRIMVSLEPVGGSPTGLPTGPVLFAGTLERL